MNSKQNIDLATQVITSAMQIAPNYIDPKSKKSQRVMIGLGALLAALHIYSSVTNPQTEQDGTNVN